MYKEFYDYDHCYRYLSRSVVMLGAEPIYIELVQQTNKKSVHDILYYDIPFPKNEGGKIIKSDDERLDFTPVKLGFVNTSTFGRQHVYKAFRIPVRNWKVGLCTENFNVVKLGATNVVRLNNNSILTSKGLKNTITGQFPSYNLALEKLNTDSEHSYIAFSRRFAIDNKLQLHYIFSKEPVGQVVEEQPNLIRLFEKYQYLAQILGQDKDNV